MKHNKTQIQEVVNLDVKSIDEVRRVIRLMRINDAPPDPGCQCTTCLIKISLVGLISMDREEFDAQRAVIIEKAEECLGYSQAELEAANTKHFDEALQPALEKKFGMPADAELKIGGQMAEDEPVLGGFHMKPAQA
jgi:hypothetical protein